MLKFLIKCKLKGRYIEAAKEKLTIKIYKLKVYLQDNICLLLSDEQELNLLSAIERGLLKAMREQSERKATDLGTL